MPKLIDIGPQYRGDTPFAARIRRHLSWYRAAVLGTPAGTGPGPKSARVLGSMLDREGGRRGHNFLSPEIFAFAKQRIAGGYGTLDAFRLLHNMLSSQPMCFNLFGPLAADLDLATRIVPKLIGGDIRRVTRVMIEHAPEPTAEYLGDRTAFDAFIEYERTDGQLGFIGIETKLTEPFSQKCYDTPAYRRWTERADSPWPRTSWDQLANIEHNQLWRDHLLAVAMIHHPKSPYAAGCLMLVRHPLDKSCAGIALEYRKLVHRADKSFVEVPLDALVDQFEHAGLDDAQRRWATDFRRRYLDLNLSDG